MNVLSASQASAQSQWVIVSVGDHAEGMAKEAIRERETVRRVDVPRVALAAAAVFGLAYWLATDAFGADKESAGLFVIGVALLTFAIACAVAIYDVLSRGFDASKHLSGAGYVAMRTDYGLRRNMAIANEINSREGLADTLAIDLSDYPVERNDIFRKLGDMTDEEHEDEHITSVHAKVMASLDDDHPAEEAKKVEKEVVDNDPLDDDHPAEEVEEADSTE